MARTRRVGNRRSQIAQDEADVTKDESAVEEIDFDDVEEVDFDDDDDSSVAEAIDVDDGDDYEEEMEEAVEEAAPRSGSNSGSRRGSRVGRGSRAGSRVGSSVGGASGRRSARMSGRTEAKASGRRSKAKKTALTAEELEAKKRGRKAMLNLFIGLILLGAAGFGIFWGLKPNPLAATADGDLSSAKQALNEMENALGALDPDLAMTFYDKANATLRVPLFANGGETINPDDPKLAGVEYALRAKQLLSQFDEQYARVDKVRNRVAAEDNLNMISDKLNNMQDLDDDGLNMLERLIKGYRENPLDPEVGDTSAVAQEEYSTLISRLMGKEQDVIQERKHRLERRTTMVQKEVNSKVSKFLGQERFQQALDHVDAESKKWPDAQLGAERDRVLATAKDKWSVARKNAEGKYADGTSATNNLKSRQGSLKAAIDSMENVIEKFGIDDYVGEARDLKSKYEQALRTLNE